MNFSKRMTPFLTLYRREIARFFKVLVQTVFAPLVSSALYLLIFGVSLGNRIEMSGGISYLAFIIPGLIMMSVLNNGFQNSSSSVVSGKFSGDLEDWRVAPLTPQSIIWALAFAGLTRGLIVGVVTFFVGQVFYFTMYESWLTVLHPGLLVLFLMVGGLSFAMFGISVAFWAKTFDHLSGVGAFVLTPLIYLGGVFFSLENLHPFWQLLSRLNPLLYFINGVRFAILGVSDVSLLQSLTISVLALGFFFGLSLQVLKKSQYSRW